MELANDELDDDKADTLVDHMFSKSSTYGDKETITFEDFSNILSDYEKDLNYASLDPGNFFTKQMTKESSKTRFFLSRKLLRHFVIFMLL